MFHSLLSMELGIDILDYFHFQLVGKGPSIEYIYENSVHGCTLGIHSITVSLVALSEI